MGYLYGKTDLSYYEGSEHGDYQFCSLDDIIEQFMVVYVGDEKLITNVSRTDVQFHAYRALAELSFDTFKSVKAQQIEVPPSLTMILPKDYVNYTKLSWVDSSGIKHPLYPTKDTSNPFEIKQNSDGTYEFPSQSDLFQNASFTDGLDGWTKSPQVVRAVAIGGVTTSVSIDASVENPVVKFQTHASKGSSNGNPSFGYCTYIYQEVDATDLGAISFGATATTNATSSITITEAEAAAAGTNYGTAGTFTKPGSTVRVGLSTQLPSDDIAMQNYVWQGVQYKSPTTNANPNYFDLGYIEWTQGESGLKNYEGELIDLTNATGSVYLVALSIIDHTDLDVTAYNSSLLFDTATVDDIAISNLSVKPSLTEVDPGVSSTFKNYKANTPHENQTEDYEDDTYWPQQGERYGLEPTRAQINGSYYIDNRMGKINFSSNIAGKTVILDYISDSLGTDGEMKVHKFAEDAMYKWITHSVLSSRINIPEYIVQRAKREKFAATRQAKLRLSNIKLEEITQILRGKSKQIKH